MRSYMLRGRKSEQFQRDRAFAEVSKLPSIDWRKAKAKLSLMQTFELKQGIAKPGGASRLLEPPLES